MHAITVRRVVCVLVFLASAALGAATQAAGPLLYAPDVVMVGRRFMVALKVDPQAPALRVIAPKSVRLYDRTKLPPKSDQRRYYFRATAPDAKAEIVFAHPKGEVRVPVQILTFEQLLQPRTVNGFDLPRCWPMGEDLRELKSRHTLLTEKELAALAKAQAHPTDSGLGNKSDDELWNIQPDCTTPRWHWVNLKLGCPVHGTEIYRRKAYYPWKMSLGKPWKVQCPVGGEFYPTNDFANGDMTSGEFPDDGFGCFYKGQKYAFIANYCQFLCGQAVSYACSAPARQYFRTGDIKAAHKALVGLCRMALEMGYLSVMVNHRYRANEHTAYDESVIGPPKLSSIRNARYSGFGFYCIATPVMLERLTESYEFVWDAVDKDPEIVPFLQGKGIDVKTGEDVRRFIERHLFRVAAQTIMDDGAASNLPRPQAAMCAVAKLLDYKRGPELMDWLYDGAGNMRIFLANYYFKDGFAYESPGYNGCHVHDVPTIAEQIEAIRQLRPELYPVEKYPPLAGSRRHKSIFDAVIDYVCMDRAYPSVGDDGTWPKFRELNKIAAAPGGDAATMLHAFKTYRTPKFAWALLQTHAKLEDAGLSRDEVQQAAAKLPADFRDHSMIFDGYGIATLRGGAGDAKRALFIKFGRFRSHVKDDMFHIGLMARKSHILTHFGYPRNWNYWSKSWATHILAKQVPFRNQTGFPTLFAESDTVHVAEARCEAYAQTDAAITPDPNSFQRRTLALVDVSPTEFYCVDIYRICGGTEHWWKFHCQEGEFKTSGLDLEPQKGTLAGPDVAYGDEKWIKKKGRNYFAFPYLYNVQKAKPSGLWSADWRLKGSGGVHFRLHSLHPPGTEVNVCDAKSAAGGSPYEMKFILAHRTGAEPLRTQVVSVFEVFDDGKPLIQDVQPLAVSGPADAEGFAPVGLRVRTRGRTDTIVFSTDPGVEREVEGGVTFAGRFGLYAERGGQPVEMTLVGGTKLTRNGCGITLAEGAYRGAITDVDRERQAITITPAPAAPDAMVGTYVFIVNNAHRVAYPVLGAKAVDRGAVLSLGLDARTGIGRVSGVSDYTVKTSSNFPLCRWRYYHGARIVNAAKTAEYRLLDVAGRATIDRAVNPEAKRDKLAAEFPLGSWFEVWDYGVGDRVEWQHRASVRR